jgi:hypothetical protein
MYTCDRLSLRTARGRHTLLPNIKPNGYIQYIQFEFAALRDGSASHHRLALWLHKGVIFAFYRGDDPFRIKWEGECDKAEEQRT